MAFRSFRATLEVIYGWGSMEYLAELKAARAFIVADETMKKLGYLGRAKRLLRRARVQVAQFTGVTPEPDIKCVGRGVALCRKFKPRVIIGLGGGSVLDATKAIRIFYEHPRLRFEEIHCSLGPPKRSIPPFRKTVQISIPATSGTGSDVSASSMVTDSGLKLKCLIFDPNLFPETVILDYELPLSMPPAL
ncbi:MAG: iron-containing alcohol dehydrogenase, partial [Nitrospinota bacterium]